MKWSQGLYTRSPMCKNKYPPSCQEIGLSKSLRSTGVLTALRHGLSACLPLRYTQSKVKTKTQYALYQNYVLRYPHPNLSYRLDHYDTCTHDVVSLGDLQITRFASRPPDFSLPCRHNHTSCIIEPMVGMDEDWVTQQFVAREGFLANERGACLEDLE